jgi:hypothetical protein
MHAPARLRLVLLTALGALALPMAASAMTVTVTVHGAGGVFETENSLGESREQGSCEVLPTGKTAATETVCTLGESDGLWNSGDIVRLLPLQNPDVAAYNAGWRIDKWVDGSGPGDVNCDPQETTGDHESFFCEFEIVEDASLDLYFKDTAGPDTHFTLTGVAEFTNSTTANFEFTSSTDSDATFECKLDSPSVPGSYYACGGPDDKAESLSGLTENGSYTFSVRGTDNNGHVESTPASQTWLVDTVIPAVSLSFPAEWEYLAVNDVTPLYTASDAHLISVRCSVDFGDLVPCAPLSDLSDGPHWFSVRAVDCCANAGAETNYFIVDTLAPNTKITSGPSGTTSSRTATFKFQKTTKEYGDLYYQCRLDAGAWKNCTSPKSYTVARGRHTFRVKAVDQAGNPESSPAVRSWRRS